MSGIEWLKEMFEGDRSKDVSGNPAETSTCTENHRVAVSLWRLAHTPMSFAIELTLSLTEQEHVQQGSKVPILWKVTELTCSVKSSRLAHGYQTRLCTP